MWSPAIEGIPWGTDLIGKHVAFRIERWRRPARRAYGDIIYCSSATEGLFTNPDHTASVLEPAPVMDVSNG